MPNWATRWSKLGLLNRWQVEQLAEGRTKFTLGPYRILDSIGKGGMGHVFKGEHAMLGRVEAVKVLPKDRSTPKAIENFQHEIRAQAQLDHPNLVRVTFADRDGETFFFVTEFVPEPIFRRLVRRFGRLTMHEAATIISQAAQAIDYAHEKGLVHRDIKPGNLLVTPDGHTKVTDLGLASFLTDEKDDGETRSNKIAGTADYLAPEVIRTPAAVGPASDIYALGCTLYYAVTGKVPFPGGGTAGKLRCHLEETPLNPRRFNPDLSDMFLDVLADMLEKDPARRIRSAAQVVEELRPWTLNSVTVGQGPTPPKRVAENRSPDAIRGMEETAGDIGFADESPSQTSEVPSSTSQGTLRLSSWQEETMSVAEDSGTHASPIQLSPIGNRLPQPLRWLIKVALLVVAALIVLLIVERFF